MRGLRAKDGGGKPFNGVARTIDGGRTWTIVHRESDRPAPNFRTSWIETRGVEDGHSVWLDAPYDLAVAPADPARLLRDGPLPHLPHARRRPHLGAGQLGAGRRRGWVSRGLDVTTHYGILWDPFDAEARVRRRRTDIGLFRSEDGGASWIGSSTGVPAAVAEHRVLGGVRSRR